MSLTERVRIASSGSPGIAVPAASQRAHELKTRVESILPAHEIVRMKAENPSRAENEVRAACAQVFADDPWFIEGEDMRRNAADALIDVLFGLGPLEGMVADESVTEIMVNGSRSLYVERDGVLELLPTPFAEDEEVRSVIDRIIGPLGRRIDEASPMVDARLPEGHRVNAVIPPIALDGPMLTIRKFTQRVITLDEMSRSGSIDEGVRHVLVWSVRARKNIAVSGGTSSGKTTLLNALSCEIDSGERVLTIEDSAELRFLDHPHVIRLEARPASIEGTGKVGIRDLVINALRMRPDRIIVGEVRGGEALEMLTAMNTGHAGSLTTLHANSPADCVLRLTTMARYAADLPVDVIEAQIGTAFDMIVQTARSSDGRRFVSHIDEVEYDRGRNACAVIPLYARDDFEDRGTWAKAPSWLSFDACRGWARPEEVASWMQRTECC